MSLPHRDGQLSFFDVPALTEGLFGPDDPGAPGLLQRVFLEQFDLAADGPTPQRHDPAGCAPRFRRRRSWGPSESLRSSEIA